LPSQLFIRVLDLFGQKCTKIFVNIFCLKFLAIFWEFFFIIILLIFLCMSTYLSFCPKFFLIRKYLKVRCFLFSCLKRSRPCLVDISISFQKNQRNFLYHYSLNRHMSNSLIEGWIFEKICLWYFFFFIFFIYFPFFIFLFFYFLYLFSFFYISFFIFLSPFFFYIFYTFFISLSLLFYFCFIYIFYFPFFIFLFFLYFFTLFFFYIFCLYLFYFFFISLSLLFNFVFIHIFFFFIIYLFSFFYFYLFFPFSIIYFLLFIFPFFSIWATRLLNSDFNPLSNGLIPLLLVAKFSVFVEIPNWQNKIIIRIWIMKKYEKSAVF